MESPPEQTLSQALQSLAIMVRLPHVACDPAALLHRLGRSSTAPVSVPDLLLVVGIDIGLIDAAQLRRQVGVVLQENLLFNRSVRENIAIGDPAAPLQAVMHAATLACANASLSPARCSPTHAS